MLWQSLCAAVPLHTTSCVLSTPEHIKGTGCWEKQVLLQAICNPDACHGDLKTPSGLLHAPHNPGQLLSSPTEMKERAYLPLAPACILVPAAACRRCRLRHSRLSLSLVWAAGRTHWRNVRVVGVQHQVVAGHVHGLVARAAHAEAHLHLAEVVIPCVLKRPLRAHTCPTPSWHLETQGTFKPRNRSCQRISRKCDAQLHGNSKRPQ